MFRDDALQAERMRDCAMSKRLHNRGRRVFPGGTTRVTVQARPQPIYAARGDGAHLIDVDGRRFLDLNNNFTTLIHGHGFVPVVKAVTAALAGGTCFANPTESEIALAELLTGRIPAAERIRFVNSGTEAVMFAIKAARAFTGRPGVARMEGAYHGAYDWAEAGQGNAPANWGPAHQPSAIPAYRGTPKSVGDDVVICRFNDIAGTESAIGAAADRLACILIDPMPSRAGLLHPNPGFLEMLMRVARKHDILIVADEVLNLRQGFQGACARHGLVPDLIALGKIIGGGFPIGAIAGRKAVMDVFSSLHGRPALPQGGTFSANPVSMIAGRVAMEAMTRARFDELDGFGEQLRQGIRAAIARRNAGFCISGEASLFRIHPRSALPVDFRQAYLSAEGAATMQRLTAFFHERAILLPNGAAACLSTAMTQGDIEKIVDTFDEFLAVL